MPFFKSTHNILKAPWEDEVFDKNWMDSDKLILPNKKDWDYKKPLQIENVNIWEVIFEQGGGWGLYASWDPYAEFYLLSMGQNGLETYYGAGVQDELHKRLKELNMPVEIKQMWVEPEDMWKYTKQEPEKLILL
jgi:hypothetical protein